jgi:hypothetical protein
MGVLLLHQVDLAGRRGRCAKNGRTSPQATTVIHSHSRFIHRVVANEPGYNRRTVSEMSRRLE